jgi:hypothetical protein
VRGQKQIENNSNPTRAKDNKAFKFFVKSEGVENI